MELIQRPLIDFTEEMSGGSGHKITSLEQSESVMVSAVKGRARLKGICENH
jgi:hypothetical protein